MRLSRRSWAGLILAGPLAALLGLHLATGFGLRDLRAMGRYLLHRRAPEATAWRAPIAEGDLADFIPLGDTSLLVLREGGLCALEGGALRSLGPPQGLLRLFPGGGTWAAGTYHRVLDWDGGRGLRHLLSVTGAVWDVQGAPDRFAVGFEGNDLESGQVRIFHARANGLFEPEGDGIPVGMDRWSGFELSPDGLRILANLPGGKGVGVWSAEDGSLLASWPAERLARVLCFLDDGRILFDRGPALKGLDAAYANAGNRLLVARIGASELTVVMENFATVLSSARWPDRARMAFSDMEGLVRVVDLGAQPHLASTFAPRGRGIPWRLRPGGRGLWVLLKGEETRLERFGVD